MLKNVIAPIQAWLMSQARCVACGRPLDKQERRKKRKDGTEQVTCECGRVFVRDSKSSHYRRAVLSEII